VSAKQKKPATVPTLDELMAAARGEGEEGFLTETQAAAAVSAILDAAPQLATASTLLGAQPIHAAHYAGKKKVVELLLRRGVKYDGFLAAELGDLKSLTTVIGAEPRFARYYDASGFTALHRACYWGQMVAAMMLVEAGASVRAATRDSVLQIAPLGCALATADTPNLSDNEPVVLLLARMLIERGAPVNHQRRDGLTALHTAAHRGHLKVIEMLLAKGADRTLTGYSDSGPHAGQTPAAVALSQGHTEAAALLAPAV
jgi:uncharacterized protein